MNCSTPMWPSRLTGCWISRINHCCAVWSENDPISVNFNVTLVFPCLSPFAHYCKMYGFVGFTWLPWHPSAELLLERCVELDDALWPEAGISGADLRSVLILVRMAVTDRKQVFFSSFLLLCLPLCLSLVLQPSSRLFFFYLLSVLCPLPILRVLPIFCLCLCACLSSCPTFLYKVRHVLRW